MKVEVITEEEFNNRSSGKGSSGNPNSLLREAINKYPSVLEEVDKGLASKMYECSFDYKGRIKREKMRDDLYRTSWNNNINMIDVIKKFYTSLGEHTHSQSPYVHEIFVTEHSEMKRAIFQMKSTDSRKKSDVVKKGWKVLRKKYGENLMPIWDLEPGDLSSTSFNTYSLAKVFLKILKYSKRNQLDPESAMTAMRLKGSDIDDKLDKAMARKKNREKYEIYKRAEEIAEG